MKQKFLICQHCGNIVAMIRDKGVPVFCCGEEMQGLIPGTTEASGEKHIPRAVSKLSCKTDMINPIPTTWIATSFEMPKSEQAEGISNNEPPAIPEAPQAANVARTLKITAVVNDTSIPKVWAAASAIIVIVTAPPLILIVAPKGIDTLYKSLLSPKDSQSFMLTGIFAAELLVKNAVIPLSFKLFKINGYGFLPSIKDMINGFVTSATIAIQQASNKISLPY